MLDRLRPRPAVCSSRTRPRRLYRCLRNRPDIGRRTVVLSIRQEGKETERILIPFEVRFRSRQVIAVTDIAAGQVISPQAVRLETTETPEPQSAELLKW